jgi:hypothetical protein
MKETLLVEGSGTIFAILVAIFKGFRQWGRIEDGVRGLYQRMDHLEHRVTRIEERQRNEERQRRR